MLLQQHLYGSRTDSNIHHGRCTTFSLFYSPALLRHSSHVRFMHTLHVLGAVPATLSVGIVA
jgi:hypothetical protein